MCRFPIVCILPALICSGQTLPQQRADELVRLGLAPQAAIVIVHNGSSSFAGYGGAKANSLVRVGSLSKVLTAQLMAKLAVEGKLKLSDSLGKYAPAGFSQPQPMTLLQLATHTSGIPRNLAGGDEWKALESAKMLAPAGRNAQYSNGAYWVLGKVVEAAAGSAFGQQLRDGILLPLGMRDTTATPTDEQCGRLLNVVGFPCADARGVASTAGMYSTPNDMAVWLQHLLTDRGKQARLAQAQYVKRESLRSVEGLDLAGRADAIGLGWVHLNATADRPALLQKTGGHDGFLSYIAFAPGGKTGVFMVLATMEIAALQTMAGRVNELIGELSKP